MITRAAKPLVAGLLLTEASPTPSPACHRADAPLHATSPGPWGPSPLQSPETRRNVGSPAAATDQPQPKLGRGNSATDAARRHLGGRSAGGRT
jgi:hypothetical protein